MKRATIFLFSLILSLAFCLSFVACNQEAKPVVITVSEEVADGTTLLAYMEDMQADGTISFSVQGGMVSEINGVENGTNSYWMLYTSDENNANTAWGTYEYEGQTLGSATLGAETLTVVGGEVYIWVYQSF